MKKTFIILIGILLLLPIGAWATHNRAGEITYEHVEGFTYKIIVTTYTKESSTQADRCDLEVFFGDGTSEIVYRSNDDGPGGANCSGCTNCGESLANDVKKNIYVTTHTYPNTGKYIITMEDPNRNQGSRNIPESVQIVFALYSELNIFPDGVPNSSPKLTNPPIDDACLREIYEHNPGAVDYDIQVNGLSDSLSYKLVACLGNNGDTIPGYKFPDEIIPGPNNIMTIDPVTGTLSWITPQQVGEYNVAILIEEWRRIGNSVTKIGSILRDLQITVDACQANTPPRIDPIADTCVTATEFLTQQVRAVDNDFLPGTSERQTVTLSATGDPFFVNVNPASFPPRSGQQTVTQMFSWNTSCTHIRSYPYFVVFRAEDNYRPVPLVDYLDWRITVNAPAPENVNAEPIGAGINVTWSYPTCTNAAGYRIYRKMDSIGYVAPACETGIPASTGYTFVGSVKGAGTTSFFDDEGGNGLISGQRYCYMVYAYFDDGAEGYPSVETCATLRKEVPIITHVSVLNTGVTDGVDSVKWAKPTELDESKHPGPYQYKILRRTPGTSFIEVGQSTINSDLTLIDSMFIDSGINTEEEHYFYRIEIYSNGELVGPSRPASSPWLKASPLDNRIRLSLNINVPWSNSTMYVYREQAGNFVFLDSANSLIYTDSNLVNGQEYCYYVTTKGGYSDPSLEFPLLNNSQILCVAPDDKQPPCQPTGFELESDCELFYNDLSWLNPNTTCDTTDDVVSYNIYYSPTLDGEKTIIRNVEGAENTATLFDNLFSVAGCYAIAAVDSFDNESPLSAEICVDNCPYYELPNVFTPGDDGVNDTFKPFDGWRYVDRVEMYVYNRWGELIYETNDPALGWDGSNTDGVLMSDGVYFFTCVVYEIRLEGIIPRNIRGTVTLLRENEGQPDN